MPEPIARILIVDDETAQMRALTDTLQIHGYHTAGFSSARAALAALEKSEFDVVLTDLKMPEMDGIALLSAAQEIDPNLVGIVMTGHGTVDTAVDAMKAGSIDYILKPFKLAAIAAVLSKALAARQLRLENIELREIVSIYDLSVSLTAVLDSSIVPDRVAEAAMQLPHAAGACVLVCATQNSELKIVAGRGSMIHCLNLPPIMIDGALSDWIERSRQGLTATGGRAAVLPTEHPLQQFIEGIAVPMFAGGTLLGILCFASTHPHRSMRSGQVKALTILANTAATAMEAALLVEKMEERVAERTSELRAANEELDAFSHSVSHDLRAPLRAVEGYCEMLLDEHSAALPSDAQRLLGQVHQGAQRMHALVGDLLSFSRSTREPMENRQVDLQALANGVWDDLRSSAPTASVQISIGALPEIIGDSALLRQVFVNLLSNAVKYSQHRDQPKIEVGATEDPQNPRNFLIFVRDNGAGFDMRYVDRLFGVFQRLHEPSEFEGTGVGLSIVRRIVARHGGRVWAEGRPDEGATFYFTLPKPVKEVTGE